MMDAGTLRGIAGNIATRLLDLVLSRGNRLPRTYGFEYEFLPERILQAEDLAAVRELVLSAGQGGSDGVLLLGELGITFEPGGQIEYLSPPLIASDEEGLQRVLKEISTFNQLIASELGIRYIGTGYIPGRYSAPLLLTAERYRRMHSRFMRVDRRGPDMMKGTAAVHLHAALTSREDIERFYPLFCRLTEGRELGMSPERRAIWAATDPCRCGLPEVDLDGTALSMLTDICLSAMQAVELESGMPYSELPQKGFDDFLSHLTTMFTDVRLNVKGGTLELRTLDSMPVESFASKWKTFTEACERVGAFE